MIVPRTAALMYRLRGGTYCGTLPHVGNTALLSGLL
jgi:hypothetical protein